MFTNANFWCCSAPPAAAKPPCLRLIGGFENPDSGEIRLDHRDLTALPPNKRPVNMVFQSYAVFPHLNVRDNIAYGLKMDRIASRRTQSPRR